MSNTINADNGVVSGVAGLKYSADTSGQLILQTNTTNAVTIDTTQNATFATGILATNPFTGTYTDGTIIDYITGVGRINVGPSDDIAFYHNGIGSRTEIARFTYGGNMGLGTASPVVSGGYTSLTINNATNSGYVVLQTNGTTTSDWYVSGGLVATMRGVGVPLTFSATGANYIASSTNGSERMRIDSSGNVGINTTSPGVKLGVVDTSAGSATFPVIIGNRGTTVGTQINIGLQTYDAGSAGITNAIGSVTTSATSSAGSADMVFLTTSAATRAERMRILSGGQIAIGASNPDAISGPYNAQVAIVGSLAVQNAASAGTLFQIVTNAANSTIDLKADARTGAYPPLTFYTGGSERVRIASNGAVLVGATSLLSSASNMQVNCSSGGGVGGANPTPSILFNYTGVGGGGAFNTLALHYNTSTVGNGASLTFSGLDSAGSRYTTALLGAVLTANTAAAPSASFSIYSLSAGSLIESLQIAPSGSIKLATAGTTINNSSGNPILKQTGSVLQVLNTSCTGEISTASATFINSGLQITITPSASTSKIFITASLNYRCDGGAVKQWAGTIYRDATNLNTSGYMASASANGVEGTACFNFLDSPATTSAITYYIKFNNPDGLTSRVNPTCCSSGAKYSYMTILEIAG